MRREKELKEESFRRQNSSTGEGFQRAFKRKREINDQILKKNGIRKRKKGREKRN